MNLISPLVAGRLFGDCAPHRRTRISFRRAIGGAVWLAVALLGISSVRADNFDPPQSPGRSLFDGEMLVNVPKQLRRFLDINEGLPGSVKPETLSTKAALSHVQSWLSGSKNMPLLKSLRETKALKKEDDFFGVTALYLVQNRRAEALASLLVAAERFPQSGPVWSNLAGVALMFGRANEAAAMLGEAERLGNLAPGPLGTSKEDAANYLHGYIFMLQGRYPEADKILSGVVDRAPQLSEAAYTLALVKNKEGDSPRRFFVAGSFRGMPSSSIMVCGSWQDEKGQPTDIPPDPFKTGNDVGVSLDQIIDLTKGSPSRLFSFELPHTASEWRGTFKVIAPLMGLKGRDIDAKCRPIIGDEYSIFFNLPRSAWKRRQQTLYAAAIMREPAVIRIRRAVAESNRLQDRLDGMLDRLRDETNAAWEPVNERMSTASQGPHSPEELRAIEKRWITERDQISQRAMDAWLPVAQELFNALEQEFELRTQFMSATLTQIGDSHLRASLEADIQEERYLYEMHRYTLLSKMHFWVTTYEPPPPGKNKEGGIGAFPNCSSEASNWSMSADIGEFGGGGIGFEISCSSVSLELNVPIAPFLGVSGEIGIDTSGAATVFIGPKFGAGGVLGGGTAKEGMYVSVGNDGVRDIGAKIEVKVAGGAPGMTNVNYKAGDFNLSFMPGPSAPASPSGGMPSYGTGPLP